MRTIKFWTSDPRKSSDYWCSEFSLSKDRYVFVFDECKPEYLLLTVHAYHDPELMRRFLELDTDSRISIYIGGEAISPDFNICDYAFGFDSALTNSDRFVRIPPAFYFRNHVFASLTERRLDAHIAFKSKRCFCNFIYSNPESHPRRDQLFWALSRYKRVDSLGPHLNNMGNITSRTDVGWREKLVAMKQPYKFSIACENASFDGYTTEKLISSFLAYSVPIYWGSGNVDSDFNGKSFINANELSDDELLLIVREIDENDDLWLQMISEPAMTESQEVALKLQIEKVQQSAEFIFESTKGRKRAPSGYWNSIYRHTLDANSKSLKIGPMYRKTLSFLRWFRNFAPGSMLS